MAAEVRYQVFISSTYEDLREERQQATQAILTMGHLPAGMELFPASDLSQAELIKRVISESDYYVVIVGARYGSTNSDGLSFTEMEYDFATELGIPVLGFVRRDVGDVPSRFVEKDSDKASRLAAFRSKVMTKHCRQFDTAAELGMQVMQSLMSEIRLNPRLGYIRADQARSEEDIARERDLVGQKTKLERKIESLQRQLRDSRLPIPEIPPESLAQGDAPVTLSVLYKDKQQKVQLRKEEFTWDELFQIIGASMFGWVMKRAGSRGQPTDPGKFRLAGRSVRS